MFNVFSFLNCLSSCLNKTTLARLSVIVSALLSMTGRVTMLGISRWAGKNGSYRTVQRFFNTSITWSKVHWCLIRHCFLAAGDVLILAADETVVTKSGKKTHGLDRFFSSLYGKTVPGLSFFTFSLISTKRRASFPLMTQQMIYSEEETSSEDLVSVEQSIKDKNKNKPKIKITEVVPKVAKTKTKRISNYHLISVLSRTC